MNGNLIDSYAILVASGSADTDLDADTRARVADMLHNVAYAVRNADIGTRDAAVQHAYMLAMVLRHPDYSAFTRVAAILRNI